MREDGAERDALGARRIADGVSAAPDGAPRWALATAETLLALRVTESGVVVQDYWGPRLPFWDDIPLAGFVTDRTAQDTSYTLATEVYPVWGGLRFGAYTAQARFADGVRDLDLRFLSARVEPAGRRLTLTLGDAVYPLRIELRYQLAPASSGGLLAASATWVHTAEADAPDGEGAHAIVIERAYAPAWSLPPAGARREIVTLAGHWAGETRIQRAPLTPGERALESRKGITSAEAQPWFAVLEGEVASGAHEGAWPLVYFGALAWSGNWQLRLTTNITGATRITGGLSDDDFAWTLLPGERFTTPEIVVGCARGDLNDARHALHRYTRGEVLPTPQRDAPLPVLYNSWEATFFDVTEVGQRALAERAAAMGIELFVVDDGWFSRRDDDSAGLGDWTPDTRAFPHGLRPLADYTRELGMRFGLWVEPEMVNPDSDLYRAHPEWVYHFPTRPRSLARRQLVLNLARDDVGAYLLDRLDTLVRENDIAFLKWDMNRPITEPGWPDQEQSGTPRGAERAREVWVRHVWGVYAVMDELRRRHPDLLIESCASGGGRADLGILRRTDQIWTSDNTHPLARLRVQEGFSLPFPPRVMVNWVTDTPHERGLNEIPLRFRFHVAMLGTLGVGGDLARWSAGDLAGARAYVAQYKRLRSLIQGGACDWLRSLDAHDHAVVAFTAPDASEAAVFAFRPADPFGEPPPPIRLRRLEPEAHYQAWLIHPDLPASDAGTEAPLGALVGAPLSGAALMRYGLTAPLPRGLFASCLIHLRRLAR